MGAAGYNTFAEVTHTVPMESLHDSFSEDELRDFDRRVRAVVDDPVYVVEPKFDGLSVALEYVNGVYTRGSTRGDGITGEEVTLNIGTIKSVPKTLKEPLPFLEVRGEVYMSDESFLRLLRAAGAFWKKSRLKTRATRRRGRFGRKTRRLRHSARWIFCF